MDRDDEGVRAEDRSELRKPWPSSVPSKPLRRKRYILEESSGIGGIGPVS
jgi:hypothetical protein